MNYQELPHVSIYGNTLGIPTNLTLTCVWRAHMNVAEHVWWTMPEWLSMYA